jgi:hypothetical protein
VVYELVQNVGFMTKRKGKKKEENMKRAKQKMGSTDPPPYERRSTRRQRQDHEPSATLLEHKLQRWIISFPVGEQAKAQRRSQRPR